MRRAVVLCLAVAQGAAAFSLLSTPPALRARSGASAVVCSASQGKTRREVLLQGGAAAVVSPLVLGARAASAEAAAGTFSDDSQGVTFMIPPGWSQQEATFPGGEGNPSSPKIVGFVSENKDINMALVTYNIRPDNAKLGSFGSIADVRKNIVRSNARDVEGEIVAEKEVNVGGGPAYVFEYTVRRPFKHLLTVFTTHQSPTGAAYLITLTMQAPASEYPSVAALYQQVAASFKLAKD